MVAGCASVQAILLCYSLARVDFQEANDEFDSSQRRCDFAPLGTLRMMASKSSSSANTCCQDMPSGRNVPICVWLLCLHVAV